MCLQVTHPACLRGGAGPPATARSRQETRSAEAAVRADPSRETATLPLSVPGRGSRSPSSREAPARPLPAAPPPARPGNGKRTRAPGCGGASGAPGKRKHRARGELPLGEAARALPVPAALLPPIGARGVTCSSRPAPLVPPRPRGGRAPGLERAGGPPGGLLAKGSWMALLEPLPA